jgi:hypothetical protein
MVADIGDVFYARTAPLLGGQPYGWWARLDVGVQNTGSVDLDVTGFRLDTNTTAPVDRPSLDDGTGIAPGAKRRLRVDEAILGTGTPPSSLTFDVFFAGFATPTSRTVNFRRYDAPTPSGGFRFPGKRSDLEPGEYWLADEHVHSTSQTYAYDFNVVRWDGNSWETKEPGASGDDVAKHFIFGKPIYAIADGYIVRCARTEPDDGVGKGGNTIIQDIGGGRYLSYHHMKQNSVFVTHCPAEGLGGPNEDIPDPLRIFVRAGTKIGEVGHSGNSSAPHLHLQLDSVLPLGPDNDSRRSLPLAFHNVDVRQAVGDGSNAAEWTRLSAGKPAALHVESPNAYLVDPNPCGWTQYDAGASEVTHHGVSAACFDAVADAVVEAGFRPVHVDGYDVGGSTYFNAVWRQDDGVNWSARHGLTAAQYQDTVEDMLDAGLQLMHADSYLQDGSVRYAAIFRAGLPHRAAYHAATAAQHQANVDSWPSLGYHPVSVSVVSVGGVRQYTAVWEQSAFPSWILNSAISAAQLTNTIASQAAAGRKLWSLDAYRHNGAVQFAAVFGSAGPATTVSPQNTSAQHQAALDFWRAAGRDTRLVTGFESGGQARFVGVWTN